ncbi:MAG: DUF499 domain-containing protein, partial [Coprothermobacterota bacterium]|nr:DUF499 domain-containing protein [Coprothermobacterota bacterium]
RFSEQERGERRKAAYAPVEGKPAAGLRPWREIVTPHPDVSSGHYQLAEFAADLWQVYMKEGADVYRDPVEFFRRTFLTEGLRQLLIGAILRLAGTGGDPVVELQTNFGGGKTHSMLALYHLFSGTSATSLPGVDSLLTLSGAGVASDVRRAVLVGTKIDPGTIVFKPDGTEVRTLWGELAWQLGGKEGYEMVEQADRHATNPGDALRQLFNRYAPCLILVDEWVAYARQLHDDVRLPAGTFGTQFTFAQALSEAAKAAQRTMLVVAIPASNNEIGGTQGRAALDGLKNAVGRVESSWRPASPDEGFEIVRRRLFQPITDNSLFIQRDAVIRQFSDMYASQTAEFPPECREGAYTRRLEAAYPIHPELFDRLYNDWSTLDKFQRTRGVLRLMAAVIHSLWENQDNSLLILPANIPIADSRVQFELTRYLEEQWPPVIAKDVDGERSLPLALDQENPNLGRYSATRRVARTIYIGSAPTQQAANKGIDERQVKLGCVQPGEAAATFGDAMRRLTDRATYLYQDGKRYWYSTQPTVSRLADDRAAQLGDDDVQGAIEMMLREEVKTRGDFAKVHACASSADVPDELEARLIILGPSFPHIARDESSPAREEARRILETRGSSPRQFRNTLVFLAADKSRLSELEQAIRVSLAWDSIQRDHEVLNLDPLQYKQAVTKAKSAGETVKSRIPETFSCLLIPTQAQANGVAGWSESRLVGQEGLAARASRKLKGEDNLCLALGGNTLRMWLDKIPLWRGDHVRFRTLVEDFAKYLYLPRLKDENVLRKAVEDGVKLMLWRTEGFAMAEGWDEKACRYNGLRAGAGSSFILTGDSLIVKPEVAEKQMEADLTAVRTPPLPPFGGSVPGGTEADEGGEKPSPVTIPLEPPVPAKLKRFHATVRLDPTRISRDAGDIAQEVVQHLVRQPGADVEITVEIQACLPEGADDNLIRTVGENCRTLKFQDFGFEKE